MTQPSICVESGKIMYWTSTDAQTAIDGLMRKQPDISRRYYRCDSCGTIHITSMPEARHKLEEIGVSMQCNELPFLERIVSAGLDLRKTKNPHQYCVFRNDRQIGELTMTFSSSLVPFLVGE